MLTVLLSAVKLEMRIDYFFIALRRLESGISVFLDHRIRIYIYIYIFFISIR